MSVALHRWGRNQETVSEDPLLAGTYGAEFSLGMQYNRPLQHQHSSSLSEAPPPAQPSAGEFMAVATLKHVLAYGVEQWSPDGNWSEDVYDRTTYDSRVTAYDMEDSYTQPFKYAKRSPLCNQADCST